MTTTSRILLAALLMALCGLGCFLADSGKTFPIVAEGVVTNMTYTPPTTEIRAVPGPRGDQTIELHSYPAKWDIEIHVHSMDGATEHNERFTFSVSREVYGMFNMGERVIVTWDQGRLFKHNKRFGKYRPAERG